MTNKIEITCIYYTNSGKRCGSGRSHFGVDLFQGCLNSNDYGLRLAELKLLPNRQDGIWNSYFICNPFPYDSELIMPQKIRGNSPKAEHKPTISELRNELDILDCSYCSKIQAQNQDFSELCAEYTQKHQKIMEQIKEILEERGKKGTKIDPWND